MKWVIPRRLLSCCRDTIMAAPAMKPIRVAFERKSIINPSLQKTKHQERKVKEKLIQKLGSQGIIRWVMTSIIQEKLEKNQQKKLL